MSHWYLARVKIEGLVPEEMSDDILTLCQALDKQDYIRNSRARLDRTKGVAVIESETSSYHPDDATDQLEDEILRVLLPSVRTWDNLSVDPIGAELCED